VAFGYRVDVVNNRLQQIINAVDAGGSNGALVIGTSGLTISSILLAKPSATVSSGVLTLSGCPRVDSFAAAAGTPTIGTIYDSNGIAVVSGLTVGISTSNDLVIDHANVARGDIVSLIYGTITGNLVSSLNTNSTGSGSYVPKLDFSDARNSQYIPLMVP
jgi:hypothetical protein